MADARAAWNDAGDRLGALGQKLKGHYEGQQGPEATQTKEELAAAAKRLGGAVQDAFEALGTAAKDKSVQADVKQVGQSVVEALGATFGQVSEELRKAFSERKGESVYDTVPDRSEQAPAAVQPKSGPVQSGTEPPEPATPGGTDPAGGTTPGREPWGTP